jgi:hypothetical protein
MSKKIAVRLETLATILPFAATALMIIGFCVQAVPALTHGVLFT